jgi:two-component system, LytTR family, response regulator
MNLSCYIVDDEPDAISILKDFIEKTPGLVLSGFSSAPLAALAEISASPPSLTFLDVDMPELNGLKFAGLVNTQTQVIFTTAYREYALDAFEKEAADYLLKPIRYERFLACIQKIRRGIAAKSLVTTDQQTSFFVKTGIKGKMQQVSFADIWYISACDHYIEIHARPQKIVTYLALGEVMDRLPAEQFSRIHKSHIIRHAFIDIVEPGQVKLRDQTILPVGQTYQAAFRKKIQESTLASKWDPA